MTLGLGGVLSSSRVARLKLGRGIMDLFMKHCAADGNPGDPRVLLGTTDVGITFGLNSACRLWSADAQLMLLGATPHFVATRYLLKPVPALDLENLNLLGIAVHPTGQYVVINATTVLPPAHAAAPQPLEPWLLDSSAQAHAVA